MFLQFLKMCGKVKMLEKCGLGKKREKMGIFSKNVKSEYACKLVIYAILPCFYVLTRLNSVQIPILQQKKTILPVTTLILPVINI